MFGDSIRDKIHPATWAVVASKKDLVGMRVSQRGTAFAVDGHGHLLTCWHVTFMDEDNTEDPDYFEVLQPAIDPHRVLRATLVERDKDRDLALLKVDDGSIRTRAVQMNAGDRIPWGRSCCAFGHPLSAITKNGIRVFTRASAGILSMPYTGPRFPGCRTIRLYEVDFFTHGGLSGGPLFLPNGCVFGVVSGSLVLDKEGGGHAARSNLSVTIDAAEAIEFLQPLGIKPQLAGHVGRNVVAKKTQHGRSSKSRGGGRRR